MKPNFALSLSFEKVELLHRSGADWTSVGEVAVDVEDLGAALSDLRKTALAKDPAGLRTKLILPDDQVKFLSLPDAKADDAAVRAALEEATPYASDDLVYEFTSDGRRTHVAAVAQETLDEAEAFAMEHKFAPVSIVAQAVVGRFEGEPYFGMTKAASKLLGPGQKVERDMPHQAPDVEEPIKDVAKAAAKPEKAEPEVKPETATKPEAQEDEPQQKHKPKDDKKDTLVLERKDASLRSEPATKKPSDKSSDPKTAEQTEAQPKTDKTKPDTVKPTTPIEAMLNRTASGETVSPEAPNQPDADIIDETPVFTSRLKAQKDAHDPISRAVDSLKTEAAAPEASIVDAPKPPPITVPQAVPARAAPGTPPPAVAERLARLARTDVVDPDRAPAPRSEFGSDTKHVPRPAAAGPQINPIPPAPSVAPIAPAKTTIEEPSRGLFASRRNDHEGIVAEPEAAPAAAKAATVFEQGDVGGTGGKPRFLGLILTGLLILLMLGVAAFASGITPQVVSSWFAGESADPDPILTAAPSDTTPLVTPLAPATEAVPEVALTEDAAPNVADRNAEELVTAVAPAQSETLDPAITADPAAAAIEEDRDPVVAETVISPETPAGTVLSPAEADRFYAATGVWLRAPRLPLRPTGEALGEISFASVDTSIDERAAADLPPLGVVIPDVNLPAQIDPPGPEVVFPRDDRGFLLATADGTISPYGMVIYAGQPAVVPPARPGTVVPEPEVEVVEETPDTTVEPEVEIAETDPAGAEDTDLATAEDVPVATELPQVDLASVVGDALQDALQEEAATRTVTLDERGFVQATADGAITPEGAVVYAGLPSIVPPTRPGTEVTDVPAAETAEDGTEPTVTAGGVSLAGLRPAVRPETGQLAAATTAELPEYDGLRPLLRPTSGVAADAIAEAIALAAETPEPPVAEDNSTVAATLAAIVATAPDPLATATNQAVARATIPEVRPRNFATVVAQAQARQASLQTTAPTTETATAPAATAVSSAAASPTGPVPQSVAAAATIEGAINLRQINLISVAGRPGDRRALVRLGNGQFVRVQIGDALDGGRVTAISDNVINYVRRGNTIALGIPG